MIGVAGASQEGAQTHTPSENSARVSAGVAEAGAKDRRHCNASLPNHLYRTLRCKKMHAILLAVLIEYEHFFGVPPSARCTLTLYVNSVITSDAVPRTSRLLLSPAVITSIS